uniref:Uncharacterized protein n=1 Tax=Oryza rufipogon TaxID=4529 RepID=A0A0E0P7T9_ORYRU
MVDYGALVTCCVALRWHRQSSSATRWSPVVVQWYFVVFVVDAIVEGDFEVKALLGLPVLAMATLSSAVHLLEGVAIGVPVQLHIKGILRVKTLDSFGSGDVVVLMAHLS